MHDQGAAKLKSANFFEEPPFVYSSLTRAICLYLGAALIVIQMFQVSIAELVGDIYAALETAPEEPRLLAGGGSP